jgi:hypothetical protein
MKDAIVLFGRVEKKRKYNARNTVLHIIALQGRNSCRRHLRQPFYQVELGRIRTMLGGLVLA